MKKYTSEPLADGAANGVIPLDNEYFCNDEEGQNKAIRWVGYFLPVPLVY